MAQVVLRWNLERGVSVIPKSEKEARIKENIDLFDFNLTEEEMKEIASIKDTFRFCDPGIFCEKVFGTFCPIFD